jgi:trehalose 6-phosphate phosphatase
MTTRWLHEVEGAVLRRLAAVERVFCFLDYDGTLSPLAPTPDAAAPLRGTATLLQEMAAMPGLEIALVSGRTIADLRRFLDVPGIYYVGIHGLEIGLPTGGVELSDRVAVVRSVLPAIKRQIEHALANRPGVLIEDKGLALACHYRLASPADAAVVRDTVTGIAQSYRRRGARISLMHGHEVLEIRSAFANKGKTVCRLLATYSPSAVAVYIGDDRTDEDAFKLLPSDSVTIRVGPAQLPTAARYRVDGPGEVQQFLRALMTARRGARRAATATPDG